MRHVRLTAAGAALLAAGLLPLLATGGSRPGGLHPGAAVAQGVPLNVQDNGFQIVRFTKPLHELLGPDRPGGRGERRGRK